MAKQNQNDQSGDVLVYLDAEIKHHVFSEGAGKSEVELDLAPGLNAVSAGLWEQFQKNEALQELVADAKIAKLKDDSDITADFIVKLSEGRAIVCVKNITDVDLLKSIREVEGRKGKAARSGFVAIVTEQIEIASKL